MTLVVGVVVAIVARDGGGVGFLLQQPDYNYWQAHSYQPALALLVRLCNEYIYIFSPRKFNLGTLGLGFANRASVVHQKRLLFGLQASCSQSVPVKSTKKKFNLIYQSNYIMCAFHVIITVDWICCNLLLFFALFLTC